MQRNMLVENPPTLPLETIKIIIPITNQYTIYRDNSNSLRYLGHQGEKNIERQAIYNDSFPFKLSLQEVSSKFYNIELRLPNESKNNSFSFHHQIARHGFHQLMLSL